MKTIKGALTLLRHLAAGDRILFEEGEQWKRVLPWTAADGDRTLRLDYPLHRNSIVIDAGAHKGDFCSDIFARFGCTVHAFEPVRAYADFTAERFEFNPSIKVYPAALGADGGRATIALSGASSSMLGGVAGTERETIEVKGIEDFFSELGNVQVDLMKVNIEGAEYALLDALDAADLMKRIVYFQVQFHDINGADALMARAHQILLRTHQLQWDFPLVWESWQLRR